MGSSSTYLYGESYVGSGFAVICDENADYGPLFKIRYFGVTDSVETFSGLSLDHLKMLESAIHQARVDAEDDGMSYIFEENQ